jgi:hypothetical protein
LVQEAARHSVDEDLKLLEGQLVLLPLQYSATSQTPCEALQTWVLGSVWHWPTVPVLHAWQSLGLVPPHAVLQHTPSTQYPLEHSWLAPQVVPLDLRGLQVGASQ